MLMQPILIKLSAKEKKFIQNYKYRFLILDKNYFSEGFVFSSDTFRENFLFTEKTFNF